MEQNKPFTNEQFSEMKTGIDTIRSVIPEHLIHSVWDWHCKIEGKSIPMPCTCASAGGKWLAAVNNIRSYIKNNSDKYNG